MVTDPDVSENLRTGSDHHMVPERGVPFALLVAGSA
jgi:hypothetical protein